TERTKASLTKYEEFLAKFAAYPKDAPLRAEMEFIGRVFRGRALASLSDGADAAIAELTKALDVAKEAGRQPGAEVVSLLVSVHFFLNQNDEAKRLIAESLRKDPADGVHSYNMGSVLLGEKDDAAAAVWFEAALRRRPDFPEAHLMLAYVASR